MVNSNYATDLIATTMETYLKTRASDAIFGDLALWSAFIKGKSVSQRKQGGLKIVIPVSYRKSTAVGSYSGSEPLDITPQQVVTLAEQDWKQYFLSVTMAWDEALKNSGDTAKLNILKARTVQAETSLADAMNADLFLDGTGNSSKKIVGLALAVDSAGTYEGISRTSDTWWSAVQTAAGGVLTMGGSAGLRRFYNDCSLGRNRMQPDLIVTTQIIHEAYEALMDPYMRFTVGGDQQAAFSNQNLMFRRGKFIWDENCQSQVLYALNTSTFNLVEMDTRGADVVSSEDDRDVGSFRIGEPREPVNQDTRVWLAFWMGNLTCDNPRFNGKMTGITNA